MDAEVPWLADRAGAPRTVLETFCGQARYARPFVARGLEYWGIDASAAMLARAPRGPGITLVEGDARDLAIDGAPPGGFDLAWCAVNSISHLVAEADVVAHLARVRAVLAPGAPYVVMLELCAHDGPWTEPPGAKSTWSTPQPDGSIVHARWRRLSADLAARTSVERAELWRERDGAELERVEQSWTMRLWTHDDLRRLAAATGLDVTPTAWPYRGEPPWEAVPLTPALETSGLNLLLELRRP